MSNVWMACPTKRPTAETATLFQKWRLMGYKIAVWVDWGDAIPAGVDLAMGNTAYPGYAQVQNKLIKRIFAEDSDCNWIVSAADDIEPDACHQAGEIAAQCEEHFGDMGYPPCLPPDDPLWPRAHNYPTFGIMQPTGDRWGDRDGAYIDRVAGSPWIGREFARRVYGGNGPYWHEYHHMWVDEELQCVAQKLGVFWQRRDLIHMHMHWGRHPNVTAAGEPGLYMTRAAMPKFLEKANAEFGKYKAVFEDRKRRGFPGHEVLA